MNKTAIFGLLAILLAFCLIGCGDDTTNEEDENSGDANMYVYNTDGTRYTGSGNITASNGSGTAHDHGKVGQISNGIINFELPSTIPESELNGTPKITALVLECNDMGLFLVNPANPAEPLSVYFIYSSSAGNSNVFGVTLTLSQGWNICKAKFGGEGLVLTGDILANNLKGIYSLGYSNWTLISVN